MLLINCKIHLKLNWIEDCLLSSDGDSAKFTTMNAKLHVSITTFFTKDNVNLTKKLNDGFNRSVYRNIYQTIPAIVVEKAKNIYELLCSSFQGVKRLFVLAYFIAANDANNEASIKNNKKYFLPRGEINNYNVLVDGKKFYDQPINDKMEQYDEVRKVSTGKGHDYTTTCLLNYAYFKDNYRLIVVNLSNKKSFRC